MLTNIFYQKHYLVKLRCKQRNKNKEVECSPVANQVAVAKITQQYCHLIHHLSVFVMVYKYHLIIED